MCLALYALFIFQFASLYIQDNKKNFRLCIYQVKLSLIAMAIYLLVIYVYIC